jgi:outer membrane protein assembly factor BamE (lipoprotein component of BamABCDE complex)
VGLLSPTEKAMKKEEQKIISACIFFVVAFLLVLSLGHHFDQDNRKLISFDQADQIKIGMTYDEVVAILGCPPGIYTATNSKPWHFHGPVDREKYWSADATKRLVQNAGKPNLQPAVDVIVRFDEQGKIVYESVVKSFNEINEPGIPEHLQKLVVK